MQITVRGKQLDVGDALRTHAEDALRLVLAKYFSNPIEANVLLSRDAHLYRSQIHVHVGRGIDLHCQADGDAPYRAFDASVEHLGRRLGRHKRRLRDHHRADTVIEPAQQYILAGETEDEPPAEQANGSPVVIAEMATEIPTLTVGEAVMRLDLSGGPAMMFRNRAHGELNMIYRRDDSTIGWVDPRGNAKPS
ncbi:MAG TPA: ribosome-associated translation inhibitor RaiA [Dongiaceae bacterium]|jgi:ribosomal subunit interface protein